MKTRLFSVLAYALSLLGALIVLIFDGKNRVAVFHARQSIALFLYVAGGSLGYFVLALALAQIPTFGAALAAMLFGLLICLFISAVVLLVLGLVNAARGRAASLPIISSLANRLPAFMNGQALSSASPAVSEGK